MILSIELLDRTVFYMLALYALFSSTSIAGSHIAIGLASVVAIFRCVKQPVTLSLDRGLVRAIGIYLISMVISGILGYDWITSLNKVWGTFYRIVPLALVVLFIRDTGRLQKLAVIMAGAMIISDLYAIGQGISGEQRPGGFTGYMMFAGYLLQMIFLTFILGTGEKTFSLKQRRLLIISTVMSMIALLFNNTRGAWLAVFFTYFIFGLIHIKKNKKIFSIVLVGIFIVSLFALCVPTIRHRVSSIGDLQSNSERFLLWRSAGHMFMDHPLTGIGAGNFKSLYTQQYIFPQAQEPTLGHAHNNFMHILAESGIVGELGFLYMFGYILLTSWRKYRDTQSAWMLAAFLVTISFHIQGLTEYNFDDSAVIRMYWFILGVAYAGDSLTLIKDK